jgi:cytosol alanyl aminopeptidase
MMSSVLGTAAFYGDIVLFDRFLARLKETQDRQERERILAGMQRFRDPAAIEAGMQAIVSGQIPFMDGAFLFFSGQGEQKTRKLAFEFVKSHFDEILAKAPTSSTFSFGSFLPYVGGSFCDEQSKAELQSFFEPRIGKLTGGPRILQQVLEGIDVCIANKAAQEPSVVSFLEHY